MQSTRSLSLIVFGVATATCLPPALAHPPAIINGATEKVMIEEVQDFRKRMAKAVAIKDAATLRAMYADQFRFTRADGRLELKVARIAAALAGDDIIEMAPAEDLASQVTNGWAAVVTGRSTGRTVTGMPGSVRWTAVYVRVGESWQLAASQATAVTEP